MLRFLGLLALALAIVTPAFAADPPSAKVTVAERRERLAKLTEDLNSDDPIRRLATLDAVLHDNDLLAREIAIAAALGSSDATMRNYAALLMLSKTKILDLELTMPAEIKAQIDKASSKPEDLQRVRSGYQGNFIVFDNLGGKMPFQIQDFDFDTGTFKASCQGQSKQDDPNYVGQITGATIQMRGGCAVGGRFSEIPCTANLQLTGNGIFTGSVACTTVPLPFPAILRLR